MDFLNNIKILNIKRTGNKEQDEDISLCEASGSNDILLISEKDQETFLAQNSVFCKLNKEFIDKIIKKKIELGEIIYTDNFLKILFDYNFDELFPYYIANKEFLYYEDNDFIMEPNLMSTFINDNIKNEIIDFIENKNSPINSSKNEFIYNLEFNIIVKPDNYNNLKELYDKNNYLTLKNKLLEQNYSNLFNLTKEQNLDKLKRVYNKITSIFVSYGIPIDNIAINVPVFNLRKNMWVAINVKFRNVYRGEYDYIRLTELHKTVKLKDIIYHLEEYGNMKYLEDKYEISLKYGHIQDYDLTTGDNYWKYTKDGKERLNVDCKSFSQQAIKRKDLIQDYSLNRQKGGFFDDMFMKENNVTKFNMDNIKINRVLKIKNSKFSSLCSSSICIYCNNNYYVINIIPRTLQFIRDIINTKCVITTNNESKIITLIDYLYRNIGGTIKSFQLNYKDCKKKRYDEHKRYFTTESYDKTKTFEYLKHNNLRYILEIIKINPYDCYGIKRLNDIIPKSRYIREYIYFSQLRLDINLKENNEIALMYIEKLKENFQIKMRIFLYNIIRNIIVKYRNNEFSLNDCINFFSKLLEIEEKQNIPLNKESKYSLKFLLKDYDKKKFYENDTIFIVDDLPFIGIYSTGYLLNPTNPKKFKLLAWFTTNIEINDFEYVLENIKLTTQKNKNIIFDNITIYKNDFIKIYGLDNKKFADVMNNFIFNICSLINNKNMKKKLDYFLNKYHKNYNILNYNYTFYHYQIGIKAIPLHIHIFKKESIFVGFDDKIYKGYFMVFGKRSNFSLENIYHYALPYYHLDNSWKNKHYYKFKIFKKDIEKIRNYYSKKYLNHDLIDFIWDNDIGENISTKDLYKINAKEYFKKLINYEDNKVKLERYFKNILKYNL